MPPQIRPSASLPQELDGQTSSSASIRRPLSSASHRPPSVASTQRPASAASVRPTSRVSTRPGSRLSARPRSRTSTRLQLLYKSLVAQVTGLEEEANEDDFQAALTFLSKNLDNNVNGAAGLSLAEVDRRIDGHAQKARIQNRDGLAEALGTAYLKLKLHAEAEKQDLDDDIKMSKLPDHMQFLLSLSIPPSQSTLAHASRYLHNLRHPPPPPSTLTWQTILAEDPLEGQHWEGVYGLPPGSTREGWENESASSDTSSILSLSPLRDPREWLPSSDEGEPLDHGQQPISSAEDIGGATDGEMIQNDQTERLRQIFAHKQEVERFQARQYWRSEWKPDAKVSNSFDIGNPSTLGPAFQHAMAPGLASRITGIEHERYIHEHDACREVLTALQNRENILITFSEADGGLRYTPESAPRLMHLSLGSQLSILSSFARTATTICRLRAFTANIFAPLAPSHTIDITRISAPHPSAGPPTRPTPRTIEAFAEAIFAEFNAFDIWCAERESNIIRAAAGVRSPLVVSLLSLKKSIVDEFGGAFDALLDVVADVFSAAGGGIRRDPAPEPWDAGEWAKLRVSPARITALVLDTLLRAIHDCGLCGEVRAAAALFRVFARAAEPVWEMTRAWLRDGMNMRIGSYLAVGAGSARGSSLDEDFFVEDNELPVLDPDFWEEGFVLRENSSNDQEGGDGGVSKRTVPAFLAHVADLVLGAGKALGLLRALGAGTDLHVGDYHTWISGWRSFADIARPIQEVIERGGAEISSAALSKDVLSVMVYDWLAPHCQTAQARLAKVFVDECDFWYHLQAIENVYLMRRGDAMSHFVDVLFGRMDSRKPWTDFHFLNTSFRDVINAGPSSSNGWITPSLVRFSFRQSTRLNDRTIGRSVRGLDGLALEYAAPFPLTYVFGPRALGVYGSIFIFLLQVRRAKRVLERILLRDFETNGPKAASDLKILYAMRGKLSWFVNTLLNFISTNVLHAQVSGFHAALGIANSLDELMRLHHHHLEKIQSCCLLQANTAAMHRAVLSILDMCIYFSDCFVAFAGDATLDITRQSINITQRHRSRHLRRQQRDVVGFSQAVAPSVPSDSDSDSDFDEKNTVEPSFSNGGVSTSLADEDISTRLDTMASELNGLVRFVRRGAESLASGTSSAASAFGVLAFSLEDWDR